MCEVIDNVNFTANSVVAGIYIYIYIDDIGKNYDVE